jgi:hypothetical protein
MEHPPMKKRYKPTLKTNYRILPLKGDPRISLTIPPELLQDLQAMADFNRRDWKEELLARLRATLVGDEFFMAHDKLMLLIYNRKLAE